MMWFWRTLNMFILFVVLIVLIVLVGLTIGRAEQIPESTPAVTRPSSMQHNDAMKHHKVVNHHWRPQPFPVNFQVSFVTNITTTKASDYRGDTRGATGGAAGADSTGGTLYYDWNLQRQRVDHDAGSYECVHFYNTTTQPCSLYFLEEGMYRIIHDDDYVQAPVCCLDLKGVGTPPPTWASDANPTFNGMVHDEFTGTFAFQWTFDHLEPAAASSRTTANTTSINLEYHTTRQVALPTKDAGKPLVFSFPGKALGRQDYHYQVDTMVEGPLDPKVFQLPEGCKQVSCK